MTTTTTLGNLLTDVAKKTGIGIPLTGLTGTTTTLTNATTPTLAGPYSAARFPIGSQVIITAGGNPGDQSAVSKYDPTLGQLTLNPAVTTGATAAVAFLGGDIQESTRVIEACSRASSDRCRSRVRVPFTWVLDGDMLASGVSAWTNAAGGTGTVVGGNQPTKVLLAFPDVTWTQVLQFVTTNATNYCQSTPFNVTINPAATVQTRYFQTAIRIVAGNDASFKVWDVTNNAEITPQLKAGSPSFTATTLGLDFVNISGTYQLPSNCSQVAYRFQSSGSASTIQLAPIVDFPIHATVFPFQNRVRPENVGNLYYGLPTVTPGGLYDILFSDQILIDGRRARKIYNGGTLSVSLNFLPIRPVYYDEVVYGPTLSAIADTVPFTSDYVERWAIAELYDYLERKEPATYDERFGHPRPTKWKVRQQNAIRYAREGEMRYGPKPEVLYGWEN